jgi:hypothetical protein
MKQYRFKKDFGYCLSGTISEYDGIMNYYRFKYKYKNRESIHCFKKEEIQLLIKQGYLEECKEPKWRDEDMIKFAQKMVFEFNWDATMYDPFLFEKKLKEYEKSKQTRDI